MICRSETWSVFLRCGKSSLTTFPIDSRPIRFEYVTCYILTTYTTKCDDVPSYTVSLSTVHKTRLTLGGDSTITVGELFLILEVARFQSDDKVQNKIYLNTFKIFEENLSSQTLTKPVLNKIPKETIDHFKENKTSDLKMLKTDLSKVKGTKCVDCTGCSIPSHCVDYHNGTWWGPFFKKSVMVVVRGVCNCVGGAGWVGWGRTVEHGSVWVGFGGSRSRTCRRSDLEPVLSKSTGHNTSFMTIFTPLVPGWNTTHNRLLCVKGQNWWSRGSEPCLFAVRFGIDWDEFSCWPRQPNGLGEEGPNPGQRILIFLHSGDRENSSFLFCFVNHLWNTVWSILLNLNVSRECYG